jgi:hypothetical protein
LEGALNAISMRVNLARTYDLSEREGENIKSKKSVDLSHLWREGKATGSV